DPLKVLDQVKRLEKQAGRRDGERWGPRPLDIDLLWFGDLCHAGDQGSRELPHSPQRELILPHPRMRCRRFVLAPLNDLAPHLELPPDGAIVSDLLTALGTDQEIEKMHWSHR
ncbi:MAG: 2-amino-4-hydroxy-6-hydroxymethyldihydropteridine diphosphokinase, partial [Acidobacteriota bacterium]